MQRLPKEVRLPISEFKRRCLGLLEQLRQDGGDLVITKRGTPIARVIPLRPRDPALKGLWKGLVEVTGEIIDVDWGEEWEAAR